MNKHNVQFAADFEEEIKATEQFTKDELELIHNLLLKVLNNPKEIQQSVVLKEHN